VSNRPLAHSLKDLSPDLFVVACEMIGSIQSASSGLGRKHSGVKNPNPSGGVEDKGDESVEDKAESDDAKSDEMDVDKNEEDATSGASDEQAALKASIAFIDELIKKCNDRVT
jgi:hypothetical protein